MVRKYPVFFSVLCGIFKAPDLTKARHVQLSNVNLDCDEDHTMFIKRVRALVNKVYKKLPLAKRKRFTHKHLFCGLADDTKLKQLFAHTKFITTKAVVKASSITAVLNRKSRIKQSNYRLDCKHNEFASWYDPAEYHNQQSANSSADLY